MSITEKQKLYADIWIENGGNDYQAAIKAGYSEATAKNAGKNIREKRGVKEYIAERQGQLEAMRLVSLEDIQAFRIRIMRGEEKDAFGLDADLNTRMKAAEALEKTLKVKEEQEEKKRAAEEALKAKTYHLDLDMIPDVFHSFVRDIRNRKHMEYIAKGGRGSTKSSTLAMIIIELMRNYHDIHAVVCRKVIDTKRNPMEITLKATGQKIYFRGADDPDKIKSISPEFGYIGILWFEELDQYAGPEEIRKIEQSAIRGGSLAWIFKSFNPPKSANNWANEYILEPKQNRLVHSSSYKDVPEEWLGKPFIDEAEHLKEVNPDAYEHEYGGVANGNGGMVFEYLKFREITDEEIASFDRIHQGVDWGWFPDPYAFIRSHYDAAQETIYLIDENGANKQANTVTGQWIIEKGYTDYIIICDSAEKKSVADYRDIGIPARPAEKGPGSVEYGMKWLQNKKIVIDMRRTPKAGEELKKYEYERDKDGKIISGYPDKDNHFIDALRYSYEPYYNRRGNKA